MKHILLVISALLCSCAITTDITYNNGYIQNKEGEIIGNYANGYIFDAEKNVKYHYSNGYIYDSQYRIVGSYNNGFVKLRDGRKIKGKSLSD